MYNYKNYYSERKEYSSKRACNKGLNCAGYSVLRTVKDRIFSLLEG